jgi:hypothetical protein
MKFLCLDIPAPGATLEKYQPHMQDEARHAWQLYKGGVVRDIYFRQDRPGVAIIAECESADHRPEDAARISVGQGRPPRLGCHPAGPLPELGIAFRTRQRLRRAEHRNLRP